MFAHTHTHTQIFRPVDLLDNKKDFGSVLVTLQFLHNIAAGTHYDCVAYYTCNYTTTVIRCFFIYYLGALKVNFVV